MGKVLTITELDQMFRQLQRRLDKLERGDRLDNSATNGGTTRWRDTSGVTQVEIGLLDDLTYGINTVKWVATTATSGTSMTLSGGLTADNALLNSYLAVGASGTHLTQIVTYALSLTPSAVSATSFSEQFFTVAGLAVSDKVFANPPAQPTGLALVSCRVSGANQLALTWHNITGGSLTPTSGTYNVVAIRS